MTQEGSCAATETAARHRTDELWGYQKTISAWG
jgi:hypothetical protein